MSGLRVDGEGNTEIVTDFVKLEVEEHELQEEPMDDDPTWTITETQGSGGTSHRSAAAGAGGGGDSGYGKPYKTTSSDRRSRGRGIRVATTPGVAPRPTAIRGRGTPRGRGMTAVPSAGRGKSPVSPPYSGRGRPRGRGRGSRGSYRARRVVQVPAQPTPGVVHLQAGKPAAKGGPGPIEVLRLPERGVRVVVVRDRLVIQRTDENGESPILVRPVPNTIHFTSRYQSQ